jgi:hypothetical protein
MFGLRKARKARKEFEPVYFFGYGSLLWPPGIHGRGMYRRYAPADLIPVRLSGYRRGMSANFKNRNFYGLLADKNAFCNGVMFPINTYHDYRALLANEGALQAFGPEQVYWAKRVTDKIEIIDPSTPPISKKYRVMTLACHDDKTNMAPISPWYVQLCEKYAEKWGEDFYNEFMQTGGMSIKQWNTANATHQAASAE